MQTFWTPAASTFDVKDDIEYCKLYRFLDLCPI